MRQARTSRLPISLLALAALNACGSERDAGKPRAFPFNLDAHCGVQTKRRDDGNDNPPEGWPQNIEGRLERLDDETAVFTSAQIPIRLVFHPHPTRYGPAPEPSGRFHAYACCPRSCRDDSLSVLAQAAARPGGRFKCPATVDATSLGSHLV